MTGYLQCDYCGEPIEPDENEYFVTIDARGHEDKTGTGHHYVNELLGHYHATCDRPCYEEMWQRMLLVHECASTLEHIPTATGQKIARLRRTHKKAD